MLIKSDINWLNELFPKGFESKESILISGPGGSGKPLVALGIANAWLKAGGSIVNIPLQYPSMSMIKESMKSIYNMDLDDYKGRVSYIQFNPEIDGIKQKNESVIEANLVKPGQWKHAVEKAKTMVADTSLGVLVFASALNLLLFNRKYKDEVYESIKENLENVSDTSYLFTVANNVFTDDIKRWEETSDNLMVTHLDDNMTLSLKVKKMHSVPYSQNWHVIPIESSKFDEIQAVAQSSRKKNVKAIKNIE